MAFVTSLDGLSARIYPMDQWVEVEQQLANAPSSHPATREFREVTSFYGEARPIDRSGAIVIPRRLRISAVLEGDVVLLGYTTFVEAWNHVSRSGIAWRNSLSDRHGNLTRSGVLRRGDHKAACAPCPKPYAAKPRRELASSTGRTLEDTC
jgi:DNA-binding transcriptional regulator/RsmH inhibitor MraZ